MSNALGKVYPLPPGQNFESLGLPTFDDVSPLDRATTASSLADSYNGVVALAVKRATEAGTHQILTGIRRAETNQTHPNVVSVPTAVYGIDAVARSLDEATAIKEDRYTIIFDKEASSFKRTRTCYATNLGLLATHLMATKLNLGESVEDLILAGAEFRYQNLVLGASILEPDSAIGQDVIEANAMLNIAVTVPAEMSDLFQDTAALRALSWVDEDDFLRGLHDRRVSDFFGPHREDVDEVEVCVHGLCLTTTALAIPKTQTEQLVHRP